MLPVKYTMQVKVYNYICIISKIKIDEFIEKLNNVAVNGVNVSQGRVSIL